MKRSGLRPWLLRWCSAPPLALLLAACSSTPQHTNTLVFGTNTRLALDVSQDPTASVGVTLGYKRQEAVWMPLLPNQGNGNGSMEPARCERRTARTGESTECEMFVGTDGSTNRDTYSVLASFGSTAGGNAGAGTPAVKGQAQIAQYFATGLAARLLAQHGGASLVNTGGFTPQQMDASRAATSEMEQLIGKVSKDGTQLDAASLNAAFAKSPGANVPKGTRDAILAATSTQDLRERLAAYPHAHAAGPMLATLRAQ